MKTPGHKSASNHASHTLGNHKPQIGKWPFPNAPLPIAKIWPNAHSKNYPMDFIVQKPVAVQLQTLVEHYFFLDMPISELKWEEEKMFPFPRITFGYFFGHRFSVTNHSIQETICSDMVISRISTDQISVKPISDRIKIIGAHVRPYTLAYLTNKNISKMPWLIQTEHLFGKDVLQFKDNLNKHSSTKQMFDEMETMFLNHLLDKNLDIVIRAIDIIETHNGNITVSRLSDKTGVSIRTLRNHFYKSIGCSPKQYIHLVRLKQSIFQMKHSTESLTSVSYEQHYADQAHFSNTVKTILGHSPKKIREKLPTFRFLQF